MRLGYGLRDIRRRATPAFWFSVAALVLAFAVDTGTTLAGGAALRATDLNPLIKGLPDTAYVVSAVLRLGTAVLVLAWFWPQALSSRWCSHIARVVLPLPYENAPAYFGAAFVLIAVPVKLVAAASNILAMSYGHATHPAFALSLGITTGVVFSNAMLAVQARHALTRR